MGVVGNLIFLVVCGQSLVERKLEDSLFEAGINSIGEWVSSQEMIAFPEVRRNSLDGQLTLLICLDHEAGQLNQKQADENQTFHQ